MLASEQALEDWPGLKPSPNGTLPNLLSAPRHELVEELIDRGSPHSAVHWTQSDAEGRFAIEGVPTESGWTPIAAAEGGNSALDRPLR